MLNFDYCQVQGGSLENQVNLLTFIAGRLLFEWHANDLQKYTRD
jgi:hypothetical protein